MADKKEEAKASAEVKPKAASKKELQSKDYVLIRNVNIGGKVHKKGTSYPLTENGRKYFKSLNYIK